MSKLVLRNIYKQYESPQGRVSVLKGVNLEADAGQTLAITGPSGSGKSTLLNIIGSLDYPTSGSACWDGIEIASLQGRALSDFRARRVGFVFQDHHLLPQLTALENVLLPTLARRTSAGGSPAGTMADPVSEAHRLLDRMGVASRAGAFPAQMSGGERQRVAIARALINGAGLLLCDEPTGSLDQDTGRQIVALFLELAHRDGLTVLMVTHNLDLAGRLERWLELHNGELGGRASRPPLDSCLAGGTRAPAGIPPGTLPAPQVPLPTGSDSRQQPASDDRVGDPA